MENDGTVHRAAGLTAPSCSMVLTVNGSRWQEHSLGTRQFLLVASKPAAFLKALLFSMSEGKHE